MISNCPCARGQHDKCTGCPCQHRAPIVEQEREELPQPPEE